MKKNEKKLLASAAAVISAALISAGTIASALSGSVPASGMEPEDYEYYYSSKAAAENRQPNLYAAENPTLENTTITSEATTEPTIPSADSGVDIIPEITLAPEGTAAPTQPEITITEAISETLTETTAVPETTAAPATTAEPAPEEPEVPQPKYIYGTATPLKFDLPIRDLMNAITQEEATNAVRKALIMTTEAHKKSVESLDKLTKFIEEAIIIGSRKGMLGDQMKMKYENLAEEFKRANEMVKDINKMLAEYKIELKRPFKVYTGYVFGNERFLNITIYPEMKYLKLDGIIIQTEYGSLLFPKEIFASLTDKNIYMGYTTSADTSVKLTSTEELVTPITIAQKTYKVTEAAFAAFDEYDNNYGGKVNPITGLYEFKTAAGGIFKFKENRAAFNDIAGKPAEMRNAINLLAVKGILTGTGNGKFSPDSTMTRAQLAAYIIRTLGKVDDTADGGFEDVPGDAWYSGIVGSAKKYGIINGLSATKFGPENKIKKDQITAIAARTLRSEMGYYDSKDPQTVLKTFSDRTLMDNVFETDTALAETAGLVIKAQKGEFAPKSLMTRGDAAIIIARLYKLLW